MHVCERPVAVLLTDRETDELMFAAGTALLDPDADVCVLRRAVRKLEAAHRVPCRRAALGATIAMAVAVVAVRWLCR